MRPGTGRPASQSAFVPHGTASGRYHADVQRRALPAQMEHVGFFDLQPHVRRWRADSRGALHSRSGPRRQQYAARRGRPLPAATASCPTVLQYDRLPGRVEDGRMESGIYLFYFILFIVFFMI